MTIVIGFTIQSSCTYKYMYAYNPNIYLRKYSHGQLLPENCERGISAKKTCCFDSTENP
uniref:Uncharacterized protein n=1 Tax=Octopus bimaculoides TaxID=37653 RepID=A0A0L8GMS1_OCTBM